MTMVEEPIGLRRTAALVVALVAWTVVPVGALSPRCR